MGHALLKKAILLLKMANVPFDLLIAVHIEECNFVMGEFNKTFESQNMENEAF